MKIRIKSNPNGDSRTAPKDVSYENFQEANCMHKHDVEKVMNWVAAQVEVRGKMHDYTKKTHERLFYDNFISTMNEGTDFVNDDWYQLHINRERHHLLSRCPEDVDLIDVIEMLVDCVCAGKARSGEVRDIEINDEILRKALNNTIVKLDKLIEVEK